MARKIALVGIGKIARDQHIPTIAAGADFELAAVASRNAQVEGVESYPDLASLLAARPDIPCISLCTPPQVRYGDALAALEAQRHVMLEKPPGATISEVEDLIERAQQKGLSLYATWHSRHAPAVAATRAWLAGKSIQRLHVSWREDVRFWHPNQDWIWQAGGLGVFDPGINALSILTEIYPRNLHLSTADLTFPENRETPIAAGLAFADPGGAEVTAEFDWRKPAEPQWDIAIETLEGDAVLSHGGARLTVGNAPVAIETTEALSGEYPTLYGRFAGLVDKGCIDADLAPMKHVADAFTLGRRKITEPFHW